uniref:Uncharacterized protein n=1 Tax=Nelumbo nucifera TaxID=4432 RepID=A0A822ZYG4_NELNU|nr:TPA_asm: hypothetical protein HUJ06_016914 [Nelumbo nucifera]
MMHNDGMVRISFHLLCTKDRVIALSRRARDE